MAEDVVMTQAASPVENQTRFELEAEFVQLLSNPFYLQCTSFSLAWIVCSNCPRVEKMHGYRVADEQG